MLYFLIDLWLFSLVFIYAGEQDFKKRNAIDRFLDEANRAQLLKQCYYNRSFQQETVNQLEKLKKWLTFQLKKEDRRQFEQSRLLEDSECFQLYSYQIEQLNVLQEKIGKNAYREVLSKLPKQDQHLDDWDLF